MLYVSKCCGLCLFSLYSLSVKASELESPVVGSSVLVPASHRLEKLFNK